MRTLRRFGAPLLVLAAGVSPASEPWLFSDWREDPERVEIFLATATVIGSEDLPVGVTRPRRLTLEDSEGRRARAAWKTVDVYEPRLRFDDGSFAINFRDSYRNEIAAYELDQLLGLQLVPPTVERTIDGELGAVRLWIEDGIEEAERVERGLSAPDETLWRQRLAEVRLFLNLTSNRDYNNIRNILVDPDFRVLLIDHSRAFQTSKKLPAETMLQRFSSSTLTAIESLDATLLEARLGEWLSTKQIKALVKRRDLILDRSRKLVELKGEDQVLFD